MAREVIEYVIVNPVTEEVVDTVSYEKEPRPVDLAIAHRDKSFPGCSVFVKVFEKDK